MLMKNLKDDLKNLKVKDWTNRILIDFNLCHRISRKKIFRHRNREICKSFLENFSDDIADIKDLGINLNVERNALGNFNLLLSDILFKNIKISSAFYNFNLKVAEVHFNTKDCRIEKITFSNIEEDEKIIRNMNLIDFIKRITENCLKKERNRISRFEDELADFLKNEKELQKSIGNYIENLDNFLKDEEKKEIIEKKAEKVKVQKNILLLEENEKTNNKQKTAKNTEKKDITKAKNEIDIKKESTENLLENESK